MDINIYGEINSFADENTVTAKSVIEKLQSAEGEDITVHINSMGGDIFEAVAIYNSLKNYLGKIEMIVEGACASAATLIVCAGSHVKAAANSAFMIHRASACLMGQYDSTELTKIADSLLAIEKVVLETYKSKLPAKSHAEVAKMMIEGTWLSAKEAQELGLVDEIISGNNSLNSLIENTRQEELNRINELNRLKDGTFEVDALIEMAITDGLAVGKIGKYINAVKSAKNKTARRGMESLRNEIQDNLNSGAAGVMGSYTEDKQKKISADIVKFANQFLGVAK